MLGKILIPFKDTNIILYIKIAKIRHCLQHNPAQS